MPVRSFRRAATARLAVAFALAAVIAGGGAAAAVAPASAASVACPPVPITVNTPSELSTIDPSTGATIGTSRPLDATYGDIAWSSDGSRLFAIPFGLGYLVQLDPDTGHELSRSILSGDYVTDGGGTVNAMTSVSDNTAAIGLLGSATTYLINLSTGATTRWATLPSGTSGDFTVLPDGDVLALLGNAQVARIHPDLSVDVVGSLPSGPWGAGQSGGQLFLFFSNGTIASLDLSAVPATPTTAALPITVITQTPVAYWGASSVQDANVCNALTLTKTPSTTAVQAPGDVIDYTFTVTNETLVSFSNLSVTDTQTAPAGPVTVTCPSSTLAAGGSMTCTGRYTATQADVDAGSIRDEAVATATTPAGLRVVSPPAPASVSATQHPSLALEKTASWSSPGVVSYDFFVHNDGNVTVSSIAIDESAFTGDAASLSAISCPAPATLAPGESLHCSATYTVSQADIARGSLANRATAVGVTPSSSPVRSPEAGADLDTSNPPLGLTNTPDRTIISEVGEPVRFTLVVTNRGATGVRDVQLTTLSFSGSDPLGPIVCADHPAVLDPGASMTCTADYTVARADLGRGPLRLEAVAAGVSVTTGSTVASLPAPAVVDPRVLGTLVATGGALLAPALAPLGVVAVSLLVAAIVLVVVGARRMRVRRSATD